MKIFNKNTTIKLRRQLILLKYKSYFYKNILWENIQPQLPKMLSVLLIGGILLAKDFHFSFSLQSRNQAVKTVETAVPIAEPKIVKQEMPTTTYMDFSGLFKSVFDNVKKENIDTDNKSDKYDNINFVLYPNYAKRNNVAPKIVEQKQRICQKYVEQFAPLAIAEMTRYDIPASLILAQAILESDAGGSGIVAANNNHLGLKCYSKKCKKGHCNNFPTKSHKDFFRKFSNASESYRANSLELKQNKYKDLFQIDLNDYKKWANLLEEKGYAQQRNYAKKLVTIIQNLKLYEYDK